MSVKQRPWIWLSSTSGQTFFSVWKNLENSQKDAFCGAFFDKDCEAFEKAKKLWVSSSRVRVEKSAKAELEAKILKYLDETEKEEGQRPLIFLCGYMRVLSDTFIDQSKTLIFNTHPSLLPAYPGRAEDVHKNVHDSNCLGGFTFHLVNRTLDGGQILFSHPVYIEPQDDLATVTQKVRAEEQKWLPQVWKKVLETPVDIKDAQLSSKEIRKKWNFKFETFKQVNEEI